MADYILRAPNPSNLTNAPVYLTESGSWSTTKSDAVVFTAKTRATTAKKEQGIEGTEIIQPDFKSNQSTEDAV